MELFVNILTLTACFATMAYCYVLAKRINAFGNMKDGMGALIEEMIRTTSDLQSTFNATQYSIDNQYHKIQDKIDEGIALSEYLTSIINDIQESDRQESDRQESDRQESDRQESDRQESVMQFQSTKTQAYLPHQNQTRNIGTPVNQYHQQHNLNSQYIKQSTLPDAFKLSQTDVPMPIQETNQPDPFADVMPSDFNSLKRKKRPKIIIPGEEYL
jgi:hypothetical protein